MSKRQDNLNWDNIYKEESPMLYGYISRKSNSEVANDILQETFLKVIQISEKTKIMNIKAYLFKTARSILIKYYKSKEKTSMQESFDHISSNDSLQETLENKEIRAIIKIASKSLNDVELDVFEYRWYHGLSTTDISLIVNKSDRHVRRLLEKTSQIIQDALVNQGYNLGVTS